MQAHEALLEGRTLIDNILARGSNPLAASKEPDSFQNRDIFTISKWLMKEASPFAWDASISEKVITASKAVPDDTLLTHWNLPEKIAWWHFERPLDPGIDNPDSHPIRALLIGWSGDSFFVEMWIDMEGRSLPNQTYTWKNGESIREMLERAKNGYTQLYLTPNGKYYGEGSQDVELFGKLSEFSAKFILAAIAWMSQKIAVVTEGTIERHRRKDYERIYGKKPAPVKVVQLRRIERKDYQKTGETNSVEWNVQWVVTGHFRNQVCGPGRKDRKLTWIDAYIKGPEDKPMKEPASKVAYEVRR